MENIKILYTSSYLRNFPIWICAAYKFSPESLPRNRRTQTSLKLWFISPHCTGCPRYSLVTEAEVDVEVAQGQGGPDAVPRGGPAARALEPLPDWKLKHQSCQRDLGALRHFAKSRWELYWKWKYEPQHQLFTRVNVGLEPESLANTESLVTWRIQAWMF